MWILLSIASALLLGGWEVFKKSALEKNTAMTVLFLSVFLGAVILLPQFFLSVFAPKYIQGTFFYVAPVDIHGHVLIFFKACLVLGSWVLSYLALKNLPIITVTAVGSLQPYLVLFGAMLIFSEQLTPYQWAGTILSVAALTLYSSISRGEGIRFVSNRWIYAIFFSVILSATSGLYDKFLIARYDKMSVQVYNAFYELLLMIPLMWLLGYPRKLKTEPFRWTGSLMWIAVALAVSDFLYFYALSVEGSLVSVVSIIRKGGIIVPFIAGALFFGDKNIPRKTIILFFMLLGMYLLYLGSS